MLGERIQKSDKINFASIKDAAAHGRLALMRCIDRHTGQPVTVICGVNITGQEETQTYEMVPFARMFEGDPYDSVFPPVPPNPV
jgi:Family of unknown function (DUF6117)